MPLAMARPWKHPKTGIYWLRRVPDDLVQLAGKREEKRSLGTREPHEAKLRLAQALAELEIRWANLRRGRRALSEREAHAIAAPIEAHWLDHYRDDPSDHVFWRTDLFGQLWKPQWDASRSPLEN